jgi:hypothetical protein
MPHMKKEVTFTIPVFPTFCCRECANKERTAQKGNTYPVVKITKTDPLECTGGERVTIQMDCGKTEDYSIVYFR